MAAPRSRRTVVREREYPRRVRSRSGAHTPVMSEPIRDRFGRVATDLRISVTDRCNFRCTYCMPADGLPWLPKSEILSYEEIARLVGVFRSMGVRTVRLTGGEPTVR